MISRWVRDAFSNTPILYNECALQLYEWSVGSSRELVIGEPVPVVMEYVLKSREIAGGPVTEVAAKSVEADHAAIEACARPPGAPRPIRA